MCRNHAKALEDGLQRTSNGFSTSMASGTFPGSDARALDASIFNSKRVQEWEFSDIYLRNPENRR
jgi:hypothetical protein